VSESVDTENPRTKMVCQTRQRELMQAVDPTPPGSAVQLILGGGTPANLDFGVSERCS
jgi:hypothetical protein